MFNNIKMRTKKSQPSMVGFERSCAMKKQLAAGIWYAF
jgi:hypothetical protein